MSTIAAITYVGLCPNYYPTTSGGIGALNPLFTEDNATGGEVRPLDEGSQVINRSFWIINKMCQTLVDHVYVVHGRGLVHLEPDGADVATYQFKARGKKELFNLIEQCLDDSIVILNIEQLKDIGQEIDNSINQDVSKDEKYEEWD